MDSEDDDPRLNQQQEFKVRRADKTAKIQLPDVSKADRLAAYCWNIHQKVLQDKIKQGAEKIIGLINHNFISEKKQKQQHFKQGKSQKFVTGPQKLIIPVCIRKSQKDYLELLMNTLQKMVQQLVEQQQQQQRKLLKQQKINIQKFKAFKNFRKINFIQKQIPQNNQFNFRGKQQQVSSISMCIRKKMKEIHTRDDITIYISKNVSNLSTQNIYIFEKGLAEFNCCIICPTTHSFEQTAYNKFSCLEILPFRLFQHKQLFCEFMYRCICDSHVKAYLPKQGVKLIYDFDDFPICYKQGSRRLIHCIHRLQMKRLQTKKQFKHVAIHQLFQILQKTFEKKVFKIFQGYNMHVLQKYIKCTLDQSEDFNLLDKYLNKIDWFKVEQKINKSEEQLLIQIRQKLIHYIEKSPNIKQYSVFLKQKQNAKFGKGKKDKDLERYKIQLKHCENEKTLLQSQIKKVITSLTSQIRKQAKSFKWEQFQFIEQIKPMVPANMFNATNQLSAIHHEIISFIYQKISIPLVRILQQFCENENRDYGELMYYMKDLQLMGFIDISQSNLNPIVTPGFFQKASYRTKKVG